MVFTLKRVLFSTIVLVIALSGLGSLSLSAQTHETAWLGVSMADTDDGVTIQQVVPRSPADEAGLRTGDIIVLVDDTPIDTTEQLVDVIQSYAPGDEIVLAIMWRGETRDVLVTLAERPENMPLPVGPAFKIPAGPQTINFMGLDMEMTDDGLLIKDIAPNSPLADSELEEADLLIAVNGQPVLDSFPGALVGVLQTGEPLVFTVLRDDEEIEVIVTLEPRMPEEFPFQGEAGPSDFGVCPWFSQSAPGAQYGNYGHHGSYGHHGGYGNYGPMMPFFFGHMYEMYPYMPEFFEMPGPGGMFEFYYGPAESEPALEGPGA